MATPVNPEFDKLKKLADTIVHQKQWNASTVLYLAVALAHEVNTVAHLSGLQKKQLVLDVVRAALRDAVASSSALSGPGLISQETLVSLNYLIDHALPSALDIFVAVGRGQFDLKKVERSCFQGCLACLPVLCATAEAVEPSLKPVAELVLRVLPNTTSPAAGTALATGADKDTVPPKVVDTVTEEVRVAVGVPPTPAPIA